MPITLFLIRHAGLHVRRFRDLHPPASLCGICLRRCSRIFTGLLLLSPQPHLRAASSRAACLSERRKRWHLSLPERSSKIALFVSSCVSAFSLPLPSAHSACCQVFLLDTSFVIYTISPILSNTPLLFFRSMYRKPTPAFFPYPATPPCSCSLSGRSWK